MIPLAVAGLLAGSLPGCRRDNSTGEEEPAEAASAAGAEQPPPTLTFASDLRAPYPDLSAFLDRFLGACLAGDYAGYRRLVSRAATPETRERFEAIYHAVETVTVKSIEPVELAGISPPTYRVVASVEFSPEQPMRNRQERREIAILVFKERASWVMAPAPAALQPHPAPPPAATSSAPATSAPSYPWDEEGDY